MTTRRYRLVTDRYKVVLPDNLQMSEKDKQSLAIDIARERARLYCVPCIWSAKSDDGVNYTVKRRRRPTHAL